MGNNPQGHMGRYLFFHSSSSLAMFGAGSWHVTCPHYWNLKPLQGFDTHKNMNKEPVGGFKII